MTTTSTFSGIGEGQRISSRVLKPPGGGSSISFGSDDQILPSKTASPAPHDSSKSNGIQNGNHTNGHTPTTNGTCNGTMSNGSMTPNGSSTTASSPGSAKSGDTQNRLFGGSAENNTARDREATPTKPTNKPMPKIRDHMRSSIFGEDNGTPSRNGTPNGTGTPSGGEATSVKETPEPPKPASAPAAQPQQRGRVPPGGHSTALW